VEDKQTPEQVAGERIREIRIARAMTQAALANAMNTLGHSWHQTTVVKTETAGRPLRLNEVTDLAGILGVDVDYLLTPPLTGMLAASQDLRELLRLEEIAEKLEAEALELFQEYKRKTETSQLARRQIKEARERLLAAGAVQDGPYWRFPKGDGGDGER
jgi:transcriptional regulator with XRE-family HTH domain